MTKPSSAIETLLDSIRIMLSADGYELQLGAQDLNVAVARIKAGPEACADCLVPKDIMRAHFDAALRTSFDGETPQIRLFYPGDPDDS